MKTVVMFSGGKDSTYATWVAQHQGWEVASLLTVRPESSESLMFHHPNVDWAALQATAMGLHHASVDAHSNDELMDLRTHLVRLRVDLRISGLVSGAVASDYQKTRFDNVCENVGLKSFAPLWHKSPRVLVHDLMDAGFRIMLTAVAAKGLDQSWLGEELSDQEWSRLETLSHTHGIHLTGEGGEYESFVLDAPHFTKAIEIEKSRTEWDGDRGRLVIERASLRDKPGN